MSGWQDDVLRAGSIAQVSAAPHPPAGTFSPYSDGEKGCAPTLTAPSPRSTRGEGWGEGQRRRFKSQGAFLAAS
ncbi:hypothetical protein FJ443_09145 [Mesorhizobium sp. B2-6-1]|nr:hypothetical protein FJ443_09145 [Mesorhizobium sp. B2-6-1]